MKPYPTCEQVELAEQLETSSKNGTMFGVLLAVAIGFSLAQLPVDVLLATGGVWYARLVDPSVVANSGIVKYHLAKLILFVLLPVLILFGGLLGSAAGRAIGLIRTSRLRKIVVLQQRSRV